MIENPLLLPRINAVVVGNGAIGSALAQGLLDSGRTDRLFLCARDPSRGPRDERLQALALDVTDPLSVAGAAARVAAGCDRVHLLINTVGMLHEGEHRPERRLKDLQQDRLMRAFEINAAPVMLLAQHFTGLLRHDEPALFASLSARVGSIADNGLGGWYSYRASKAAHNMLLRTLALEWRVSHPRCTVVALHPGTVKSRLSEPFVSKNYRNKVLSPDQSAAALVAVMEKLGPSDSGSFYDWQGDAIPW
jgi:NAD(P)-dependent dehydrogenase (short-subunit alcohol dehydrogenase family)